MVTCERCHRKFASYSALKQHYGSQHRNVGWPEAFEEKLTAERDMESYKADLRPRKSSRTKLVIAVILIVIVVGAGWIYLPSFFQTGPGSAECSSFPFEPIGGRALAIHYHVQLLIYVNGQEVKIPVNTGEGDSGPCTQPLHVHTGESGTDVIHIESPQARSFTLGEFFKVWAATPNIGGPTPVVFDQNQIFGNRVGNGYELRVYVNGQQSSAYDQLVLQSHMIIVITYGASGTDWSSYQDLSAKPWPYPDL